MLTDNRNLFIRFLELYANYSYMYQQQLYNRTLQMCYNSDRLKSFYFNRKKFEKN